jgi:predicted flap endonuclease-1-like 5' DNA nuclease
MILAKGKVTMSTRERLTQTEQYIAYLIGAGIVIALVALLLRALGTIDDNNITAGLLLVGLALLVVGIGAWLILVRPWEKFDDLKTPYFVGHDEEVPAPETAAEVALGDAIPVGDAAVAERSTPEVTEAPPEPIAAAISAPPVEAAEVLAPPEKQPDNLTLIEGIGPKTAAALAEAGITSFAQIATMKPDELIQAARAHGARVGKADTWPEQAHRIISGNLTDVEDYQARIRSGTRRDDLTQIEGIGPKVQSILYSARIFTFDDLAQAKPDVLRTILQAAGLRIIQPDTWPEQAGYIARDDLSGLQKLQQDLQAGRHRKTE